MTPTPTPTPRPAPEPLAPIQPLVEPDESDLIRPSEKLPIIRESIDLGAVDAKDAREIKAAAVDELMEQKIDKWPSDYTKEIVTLFSHPNWKDYPEEVALIECLRSDEFREFIEGKHFVHLTSNDILFRERFQDYVDVQSLPALMVQWPNGGTYYSHCGAIEARTGSQLVADIKEARSVDPILDEAPEPGNILDEDEVAPDFINPFYCPDNSEDQVEMRIRDAISRTIMLFTLIIVIGVILLILPIAVLIFYIIKP